MTRKEKEALLLRFMQKSSWISFLFIAFNWALIALSAALSVYSGNVLLYIACLWFIASRMVALAEVFGHDSVHYNLFRKRAWNRKLDFLWFLPVFESWENYRKEHQHHHGFLLRPQDPAWQDYQRWGLFQKKKNMFWIWFIRPFLFFDSWHMLKTIAVNIWKDALYRKKVLSFWLCLLLLFGGAGALELLFLYWIVPLFWAYPALIFWSETGEHFGIQGERTRNTFGFLEWLFISPHNDRFHYVHHKYPNIPWFRMKAAYHSLFVPEKVPASYGFLDLYRQVRAAALHTQPAYK